MRCYILDDNKTVVNSITLEDGADPAIFGAIADDRVFDIGETWTPPPTEADLLRQQVADLQNQILAMRLGGNLHV